MNTPLQTVDFRLHVFGIRITVCLAHVLCCSTHIILTVKTSEQHSLTPMVFSTLCRCASVSSRPIVINSSHCMKETNIEGSVNLVLQSTKIKDGIKVDKIQALATYTPPLKHQERDYNS